MCRVPIDLTDAVRASIEALARDQGVVFSTQVEHKSEDVPAPLVVGSFVGISGAFRCSVVTTATGATRRGLANHQEKQSIAMPSL